MPAAKQNLYQSVSKSISEAQSLFFEHKGQSLTHMKPCPSVHGFTVLSVLDVAQLAWVESL